MMDSRKAPSSNPFSPVSSAPAPSSTGVGVADSGAGGGTGSGPDDPEVTWWCRILIRVIASIVGAGQNFMEYFALIFVDLSTCYWQ